MRIVYWSSDVCASDLGLPAAAWRGLVRSPALARLLPLTPVRVVVRLRSLCARPVPACRLVRRSERAARNGRRRHRLVVAGGAGPLPPHLRPPPRGPPQGGGASRPVRAATGTAPGGDRGCPDEVTPVESLTLNKKKQTP